MRYDANSDARTGAVLFNRIAVLRAERGLSRSALADALDINYQTVGYIERGDFNPSLELAFRISEYFGLANRSYFLAQTLSSTQRRDLREQELFSPWRLKVIWEDIMLRTPAFLGFSMVSRSSRRLLVATTYTTLMALMATVISILPSGRQIDAIYMCIFLAYNVASRAIFGSLVKATVLPEFGGGRLISLSLAPRCHRGEDEPDEREVAVRNAAYFEAYRALAVYSMAIWVASPFFFLLNASTAVRGLQLLSLPLLAMALTLPQSGCPLDRT